MKNAECKMQEVKCRMRTIAGGAFLLQSPICILHSTFHIFHSAPFTGRGVSRIITGVDGPSAYCPLPTAKGVKPCLPSLLPE